MDGRANTGVAWPYRYELLDGLRGVASLLVVLNHLTVVSYAVGHYAVMLFFVISGYCVTASAESNCRGSVGFKQFMARRIMRIYPPYLLAVAFFVVTRVVKSTAGGHSDLRWSVPEWIQNLTLTQWLSLPFHPIASPIDNPTLFVPAFWSLNYEEQFYLVMAVALILAIHRRLPLIMPVLFLGAIGLVWNWMIPGNWSCGLFIEYWAHFALGSCLFFVLSRFIDRPSKYAFVVLVAILGTVSAGRILAFGSGDPSGPLRAMVELSFLSATTLVLFYARPLSLRISESQCWRPLAALGAISYSLYLIHSFNLRLVASAAQYLIPSRWPHFLDTLTQLVLLIALATLFWWFCERPFVRRKPASRILAPLGEMKPA